MWEEYESMLENATQKILTLDGWRGGGRRKGRKFRTLGFISLREHIERKKYPIFFSNLEGKGKERLCQSHGMQSRKSSLVKKVVFLHSLF